MIRGSRAPFRAGLFPLILLLAFSAARAFPADAQPLSGVWEGPGRFVEFSADGRMRIVLKTYYGFVYDDTGWIPCETPTGVDGTLAPSPLHRLSIRYPSTKKPVDVPVALIGETLHLQFMVRLETDDPAAANSPSLDGTWLAAGTSRSLLLYPEEPATDLFVMVFSGSSYYRIRYWKDDVRFRDIRAEFTGTDGAALGVPKFLRMGEDLYTCVTSTGRILRNYESGTFTAADGKIAFSPAKEVYAGTAALYREPIPFSLSGDGAVLALGEPYLRRSKIVDLSAEVAAHNKKRRPLRKPLFEIMKLDFHWEEIERIRNNGKR